MIIQNGVFAVSVDTQYESPGHCANQACVTFVETETRLVLHVECIHKRETGKLDNKMAVS